ncbi:hypothetical protein EDD21DRAFT_173178 [Dissophora ornata]|nr:hypothetical protein EDD21DRAFT_173178 [Dissophora ornata]
MLKVPVSLTCKAVTILRQRFATAQRTDCEGTRNGYDSTKGPSQGEVHPTTKRENCLTAHGIASHRPPLSLFWLLRSVSGKQESSPIQPLPLVVVSVVSPPESFSTTHSFLSCSHKFVQLSVQIKDRQLSFFFFLFTGGLIILYYMGRFSAEG